MEGTVALEPVAANNPDFQEQDNSEGTISLLMPELPIESDLTDLGQAKPKSKPGSKELSSGSTTPRGTDVTSILDEDSVQEAPVGASPSTASSSPSAVTKRDRPKTPPPSNKRNAITLLSPRNRGTFDNPQVIGSDDEDGLGRFSTNIESLHGVIKRSDVVSKRRKLHVGNGDQNEDEEDPSKKWNSTFKSGGGGIFSDFRRAENEKAAQQADSAASIAEVIELDDDDDTAQAPVAPKRSKPLDATDKDDEIVCLGEIRLKGNEEPKANAWSLPYKNLTASKAELVKSTKNWPPIPIFFRANSNMIIDVEDSSGYSFAKLDVGTTRIVEPLLKGPWKASFRAKLCQRIRNPGEQPGDQISARVKLSVVVFAPRGFVELIGNFLKGKEARLFNVYTVRATNGLELCNPHEPKSKQENATRHGYGASSTSGSMVQGSRHYTRSNEEMAADIMTIFNTITDAEQLPEAEAPNGLKSELMSHQRKALFFFAQRETDQSLPTKHGEEGFQLWKMAVKDTGMKVWYNVITGHEVASRPQPVLGGILADMMGLGKTLSMLSLILSTIAESKVHGELIDKKFAGPGKNSVCFKKHTKGTLLVCPLSTVVNWENQVKDHVKEDSLRYYIYHGHDREQDLKKLREYDLIITTYQTVSSDYKKWCSKLKAPLFDLYWFRISLDEAHIIRNADTETALAHFALEAKRRWAVTGTPVQNRLDDLGSLIRFLRFKPFDEKSAFNEFVLTPFKNADPEILPKLRLLVDSIMLRRLKNSIPLPEKHDDIYRIPFSKDEEELYRVFVDDSRKKLKMLTRNGTVSGRGSWGHIFKAILRLRLICAHGEALLQDEDRKLLKGLTTQHAITVDDDEEDAAFVNTAQLSQKQVFEMVENIRQSEQDNCPYCNRVVRDDNPELDNDEDQEIKVDTSVLGYVTPDYHIICAACHPRYIMEAAATIDEDNQIQCPVPGCRETVVFVSHPVKRQELREQADAQARVFADPKMARLMGWYRGPSSKVKFMLQKLEEWRLESLAKSDEAPIKCVVFSSWTNHLDLIQLALKENNIHHTRLDGKMSAKQRRQAISDFDSDENVLVILVSIGAGGLGLNLVAGNKAFIMEPSYNPAAEAQAVDRVHRIGQQREVEIIRLIMHDSFEENMIELQKKKVELAELAVNRSKPIDKEEERRERLLSLRSLFR